MTYAQMITALSREALKTGKPHVLINLNPFGSLYVIREMDGRPIKDKIVLIADPAGTVTIPAKS